jgi:hypothetical protein
MAAPAAVTAATNEAKVVGTDDAFAVEYFKVSLSSLLSSVLELLHQPYIIWCYNRVSFESQPYHTKVHVVYRCVVLNI